MELSTHIGELADGLVRGVVTPVLGAGASLWDRPSAASWSPGSGFYPSGAELAEYLARVFYIDPDLQDPRDLMGVASCIEVTESEGALHKALHEVFSGVPRSTLLHEALARAVSLAVAGGRSRGVPLILTTNYDHAMEIALDNAGVSFNVMAYVPGGPSEGCFKLLHSSGALPVANRVTPEDREVFSGYPTIVKLHGSVEPTSDEDSGLVIAESHYVDYLTVDVWERLPWMVVNRLRHTGLLFLGYAMRDWNLLVVLRRLGILPARPAYPAWAVQLTVSQYEYRRWERQGVGLVEADLAEYASELNCALVALSEQEVSRQDSDQRRRAAPASGGRRTGRPDARTISDEGPAAAAAPRECPYQGPAPYNETDAEWYFGRNDMADAVLDGLGAHRVTVVYGDDGVGKTSLLQAAVLPRLQSEARNGLAGDHTPGMLTVIFSAWTSFDPAQELKETIGKEAALIGHPVPIDTHTPLADLLAMCSRLVGGDVFVILDQLERLYYRNDDVRSRIEEELLHTLNQTETGNFVLSIRADALGKLHRLHHEVPTLLNHLLAVAHLDEVEAREAIERPLQHWTALTDAPVMIEPALVDALLFELRADRMRQDAGTVIAGSHLQRVLTRIWHEERREQSNVLRLQTLRRIAGVNEIVCTELDHVMAGLGRADQQAAVALLRFLVSDSSNSAAHQANDAHDLAEYTLTPAERIENVLSALDGKTGIIYSGPGGCSVYEDILGPVRDWLDRYRATRPNTLSLTRRLARARPQR